MKNSRKSSLTVFCVISLLSFLMIGCAGGTPVQFSEPATPTPLDVSVTISPPSLGIQRSGTWNFAATVLNSANTAVTWGIQENSAGGTINQTGVYTAPAVDGVYHITATVKPTLLKTPLPP